MPDMPRDEAERLLDEHEEATADATMQHSSDFKSERKKQRYRESRAAVLDAMTRATPEGWRSAETAERLLDECLGSMVLMPMGQSDRYKEARAAVIAAMTRKAPEGWKLVPETPTADMLTAAHRAWTPGVSHADAHAMRYAAMLAAAPEAPK